MNDFTPGSYALFEELASEKYAECKSGEKMTFGKCQKVGGSGGDSKKTARKTDLNNKKATAERNLAVAKKNKNAKQQKMFSNQIASYNKQISALG